MKKNKFEFAFIIGDQFPDFSFLCATECIKIANRDRAEDFFTYKVYSIDNKNVLASNGSIVSMDDLIENISTPDYIFLFDGDTYSEKNNVKINSFLRKKHHEQVPILAVASAPFILAEAGLITNIDVTIHWRFKTLFKERYPHINVVNDLCVINKNHINFCAGGLAMLDFMINLVKQYYGFALGNEIANHFIHNERKLSNPQRKDLEFSNPNEKFICKKAIGIMDDNIEFPIKISEIATKLSLSVRTLEREFIYAHSMSPLKFYLRLRLNHAKNFLYYENYKINVISNMCGFNYNSVFNHAFKKEFHITPKEYRNNSRKFQNEHIKPELKKLH